VLLERLKEALPGLEGAHAPRPMPMTARRHADGQIEYAGADTLLRGDASAGALSILPEHVVRRIEFSGNRATALQAFPVAGGDEVRIEADTIVVAAGVLGTPQLLFASGVETSPALGGYLTDHLNFVGRVLLADKPPEKSSEDDPPVSLVVPVSEGRPFQFALIEIPGDALAGPLTGVDTDRVIDIGAFIGTEPVESNRLKFDPNSLDGFGLPRISAHVELTSADHQRVQDAFAEHYQLTASLGEPWRGMAVHLMPFGSSLHLMGTHRMGADPRTSVVNAQGRVWNSENLYLAGNGVLGSRNSCNPTLTTVALGLRAAEAIVASTHPKARVTG